MHEEYIGPDGRPLADHCLPAKNRGVWINSDVITHIGMTLSSLDDLSVIIFLKAAGSKRHRMVEFHMMTNPARLPDDHAGSMVDKEVRPDGGSRMDIDSGALVGPLRHHAGEQLNACPV